MAGLLGFMEMLLAHKSAYIMGLIICEILFSIGSRFRKIPGVRLQWLPAALTIAVFAAGAYYMPLPHVGRYSVALQTLLIFGISILLQWCVLDLSFWHVLFHSIAAYASENLALNIYEIILFFADLTGWWKIAARLASMILVYSCCYFLFARKAQRQEIHIKKPVLIQLALITIFISNFLFSFFSREFSGQLQQATRIPLAVCCFLALEVQFATFKDSSLNQEKEILEQMLFREQRQHKLMQETIDIINMKSHDLKNQIGLLKKHASADSAGLIEEVEEAVSTYDSLVDTGNKSLDIIISEEKLICNQYGIPFDIMADGAALDFITPEDLYSLIGNALRNAVESSLKEEERRRTISLDIHRAGEYVCVEISNFCSQEIAFSGGFPVTSKNDNRFHGFGIKSMEYMVKKYGGNMVIRYQDHTFTIKILFPKQREAAVR